jgi:uncharacterized phage protein (predicted DNA packaging)
MNLTVDEIKNWLRIDHNEDDSLLEIMIIAAEQSIKGSIGFIPMSELGTMVKRMIITDWYENRGSFVQGSINELPLGVRSILTQMRYTGDPS